MGATRGSRLSASKERNRYIEREREREYRRRETKGELQTGGNWENYYRGNIYIYSEAWRHGRDMAKNKGRSETMAQQRLCYQETVGPGRGKVLRQSTATSATL